MGKLTVKQELFVVEYLIDLNATQAAVRAGYSERTAAAQAARLLRNVKVQKAIQESRKRREKRTEITQDRVLQELAAIGFSKGTDYAAVDSSGRVVIKPTEQLGENQQAAVIAIKETQNGVEIKLADKVKALELLGKHLGMFNGDKGQGEGMGFTITVVPASERGDGE